MRPHRLLKVALWAGVALASGATLNAGAAASPQDGVPTTPPPPPADAKDEPQLEGAGAVGIGRPDEPQVGSPGGDGRESASLPRAEGRLKAIEDKVERALDSLQALDRIASSLERFELLSREQSIALREAELDHQRRELELLSGTGIPQGRNDQADALRRIEENLDALAHTIGSPAKRADVKCPKTVVTCCPRCGAFEDVWYCKALAPPGYGVVRPPQATIEYAIPAWTTAAPAPPPAAYPPARRGFGAHPFCR